MVMEDNENIFLYLGNLYADNNVSIAPLEPMYCNNFNVTYILYW